MHQAWMKHLNDLEVKPSSMEDLLHHSPFWSIVKTGEIPHSVRLQTTLNVGDKYLAYLMNPNIIREKVESEGFNASDLFIMFNHILSNLKVFTSLTEMYESVNTCVSIPRMPTNDNNYFSYLPTEKLPPDFKEYDYNKLKFKKTDRHTLEFQHKYLKVLRLENNKYLDDVSKDVNNIDEIIMYCEKFNVDFTKAYAYYRRNKYGSGSTPDNSSVEVNDNGTSDLINHLTEFGNAHIVTSPVLADNKLTPDEVVEGYLFALVASSLTANLLSMEQDKSAIVASSFATSKIPAPISDLISKLVLTPRTVKQKDIEALTRLCGENFSVSGLNIMASKLSKVNATVSSLIDLTYLCKKRDFYNTYSKFVTIAEQYQNNKNVINSDPLK